MGCCRKPPRGPVGVPGPAGSSGVTGECSGSTISDREEVTAAGGPTLSYTYNMDFEAIPYETVGAYFSGFGWSADGSGGQITLVVDGADIACVDVGAATSETPFAIYGTFTKPANTALVQIRMSPADGETLHLSAITIQFTCPDPDLTPDVC